MDSFFATKLDSQRIQRKRTKGWRMPVDAVYVGRGSKWGNPYVVRPDLKPGQRVGKLFAVKSRQMAAEMFLHLIAFEPDRFPSLDTIHGKRLACWCPLDQPCHADVLFNLANR